MIFMMAIENESDKNKAKELFEIYRSTMLYMAIGVLGSLSIAEDAVSESFVKIINNLDKIKDANCIETRSYVVIIVKNTCLDFLRRQKHRNEVQQEEYRETLDDDISAIDCLITKEACTEISAMIHSLSPTLSDALYLSVFYGHSNAEIAKLLSISLDAAKMRLSRAKKEVRQLIRKEGKANEVQ